MQRKIWSLVLLVAAVLVLGSAAWADGDLYVVAGGGPPVGTKITSVPYTIKTPGFYFLTGNLTYNGSGPAISLQTGPGAVKDVTIDLMGFSLTNTGPMGTTMGIHMSGSTNVEIRNGTVRGFNYGVFEDSSTIGNKHRIINVRAYNNNYGIYLKGSDHLIKNCSASDNLQAGIYMGSGLITDCVANSNGTGNIGNGIQLDGPGSVLGNTASYNKQYNFYFGANGVPAGSILVDRNSACCTNYPHNNYYNPGGGPGSVTIAVITSNNSDGGPSPIS